jgi:hypothetical protein
MDHLRWKIARRYPAVLKEIDEDYRRRAITYGEKDDLKEQVEAATSEREAWRVLEEARRLRTAKTAKEKGPFELLPDHDLDRIIWDVNWEDIVADGERPEREYPYAVKELRRRYRSWSVEEQRDHWLRVRDRLPRSKWPDFVHISKKAERGLLALFKAAVAFEKAFYRVYREAKGTSPTFSFSDPSVEWPDMDEYIRPMRRIIRQLKSFREHDLKDLLRDIEDRLIWLEENRNHFNIYSYILNTVQKIVSHLESYQKDYEEAGGTLSVRLKRT